jgi:hypothetical protein
MTNSKSAGLGAFCTPWPVVEASRSLFQTTMQGFLVLGDLGLIVVPISFNR